MKLPKGKFPYIMGGLFAIIILALVFALPETMSKRSAKAFAEPLYNHEMPAGARFVSSSANQGELDGEGSGTATNATLILQCDWSQQQIYDFYNDISYPPAREGDVVTLSVTPLDDSSLDALRQADLYQEDGGSYWFVYLYSASKTASN